MASAAGAAIGGAIGGVPGAIVGALIGAAIDNFAIMPALFRGEQSRPGLGSLDVNYADEGAPATFAYGDVNRIGCQIVYASLPWSVTTGGSHGKRQEPAQTTWYADIVYVATHGKIGAFREILFDADPVYSKFPNKLEKLLVNQSPKVKLYFDEANTSVRFAYRGGLWILEGWDLVITNHPTAGIGGTPVGVPELAQFPIGHRVDVDILTQAGSPTTVNVTKYGPLSSGTVPVTGIYGTVVESRVTGTSSTGVQNTRLTLDLSEWLAFAVSNGLYVWTASTPPSSGGTPPTIPVSDYPLRVSPPPPGLSTVQLVMAGEQFAPGSMDPDLTEFHKGPIDETPSTLYGKRIGSARAPALPRISYLAAAAVNLSQHGNRVPQMTGLIDQVGAAETVVKATTADVVKQICSEHADLPSYLLDVSELVDDLRGINFAGTQPVARPLGAIVLGKGILIEESSGVVRFKLTQDVVPADHDHLDARPFDADPEPKLVWQDQPQRDMPKRIHVRFIDVGRQNQYGDIVDQRDSVHGASISTHQVQLDYAMDVLEARTAARRILRDIHEQRQRVKGRLPAWYLHVTESDILEFSAAAAESGEAYLGETIWVQIDKIDQGASFYIDFEGVILNALPTPPPVLSTAGSEYDDQDVGRYKPRIAGLPLFATEMLDALALQDEDATRHGVYVGAVSKASPFQMPGGVLTRALGNGDKFTPVGPINTGTMIGRVVEALRKGVRGVFDYTTSMVVELLGDELANTLASATEQDVREDWTLNLAAIGREGNVEIVQFTTVEDLNTADGDDASSMSGRRFRLSGFRRGLYGSEGAMGGHTGHNETFMVIDPRRLEFVPVQLARAGTQVAFKAVPSNGDSDNGTPARLTVQLNASLPLPVANLKAVRLGSGDVVFTWNRRSRVRHRCLGEAPAPLVEGTESYDVIVNPSTTNRNLGPVSTGTATYSAAQQTTDSTTDLELTVEVYQLDSVRGRGRVATLIVPATWDVLDTEDDATTIDSEVDTALITEF